MQHIGWQASQPGHMHPIGPIRSAGNDLMQKHDAALPFTHLHGMALQTIQRCLQMCQLVIMRGKQCPAQADIMQMFQC